MDNLGFAPNPLYIYRDVKYWLVSSLWSLSRPSYKRYQVVLIMLSCCLYPWPSKCSCVYSLIRVHHCLVTLFNYRCTVYGFNVLRSKYMFQVYAGPQSPNMRLVRESEMLKENRLSFTLRSIILLENYLKAYSFSVNFILIILI